MTSTDHPAENVYDRIATWHVVTGSARGAAHKASGRPNQDAVAREDGPDGAVTVAIADGHGHARHFRSADGSALAVVVACRVASRMAARLAAGAPRAEAAALAGQELTQAIVADWRSAVAAQLRTTSLCQADAVASFRTGTHDLRQVPLATLLLATDGYGNSQAEEPWQPGVGRDLAELAAEHDHHWFEQQVPGWARRCASAEGSGDDTTIALLLRPKVTAQVHADAEGGG
jgi:hypothetical protein